MKANFYKYQALGNDMVVIDPATFDFPLTPIIIRLICDRHFGLGADGVCYGPCNQKIPHLKTIPTMRFFNPDGSESGKSGNGLRVFARYVWDQGYVSQTQPEFEIGIGSERIQVIVQDETARMMTMNIGRLSFTSQDIPVTGPIREVVEEVITLHDLTYQVTGVTVGNPHCVIFADTISKAAICTLGPILETAPHFPERTNVQLVRVIDRHTIAVEIWERGAGYTLASGTSASATAGAAVKTGRCDSPVTVQMAGGVAQVAVDETWQVTLTGPVETVCSGTFAPDLVAKFE
jgi:diaminopimelate epimerase